MEFDEFYKEHYSRIYRTMVLTFRDSGLSEEITQEAFYRALRRWPKVSTLNRPDAWTMVVALNCGRDGSRRRKLHEVKTPLLAQDHASRMTSKEGEIDDQMAVVNLLASVSSRQREVLVLRYIAQLSVAEIAEAMKCAEGTVKSTLHVALERANEAMRGSIYAED